MVKRTEIILTDDLDDGPAAETVRFGVDGKGFEIDLSAEHAEEMRSTLERFVTRARMTGGYSRQGRTRNRTRG